MARYLLFQVTGLILFLFIFSSFVFSASLDTNPVIEDTNSSDVNNPSGPPLIDDDLASVSTTASYHDVVGVDENDSNLTYSLLEEFSYEELSSLPSYGDVYYPPGVTPENAFENSSRTITNPHTVDNEWSTTDPIGSPTIPVLLIEFPDNTHSVDASAFEDLYNSNDYLGDDPDADGVSVKTFYEHNSYDQLNLSFDVYGWAMAENNYDYYVDCPICLTNEAVDILDTEYNVDFTDYDNDNDGRFDGLMVVHAGEEGSDDVPSSTFLYYVDNSSMVDGVYYGNISNVSEKANPAYCDAAMDTPYGYPDDCRSYSRVHIHEFAHILGVPDLYAIEPDTGNQVGGGPIQYLTVMVGGGSNRNVPINFDPWSKIFFQWIEPTYIESGDEGNYDISSIDSNPEVYKLRDSSKQEETEYFIVSNKYFGTSYEDSYDFHLAQDGGFYNELGGLEIYQIDDDYIEENYPSNTINYDADDYYVDDAGNHPGIIFEQNMLASLDSVSPVNGDFYTTEINDVVGEDGWNVFSDVENLAPDEGIIYDTTSDSYSGEETDVLVSAESESGYTISAYLQSVAPAFSAEISSPSLGDTYHMSQSEIYFEADYEDVTNPSCSWYLDNTSNLISTNCSFYDIPEDLDMSLGNNEILLEVSDGDTIVSDSVEIEVIEDYSVSIDSPESGSEYLPGDNIYFNANLENNIGSTSCDWYSQVGSETEVHISDSCEFTSNPNSLGISQGPVTFILESQDSDSPIVSDSVEVTVLEGLEAYIVSPENNSSHFYMDELDFTSDYSNASGGVDCEWRDGYTVISNECNFTTSYEELNDEFNFGIGFYSNSPRDLTLEITDSSEQSSSAQIQVTVYGQFYLAAEAYNYTEFFD